MGMYDSVEIKCRGCGGEVEFQSKVGDCLLHWYTLDSAPVEILLDLNGETQTCTKCDRLNELRVKAVAFAEVI